MAYIPEADYSDYIARKKREREQQAQSQTVTPRTVAQPPPFALGGPRTPDYWRAGAGSNQQDVLPPEDALRQALAFRRRQEVGPTFAQPMPPEEVRSQISTLGMQPASDALGALGAYSSLVTAPTAESVTEAMRRSYQPDPWQQAQRQRFNVPEPPSTPIEAALAGSMQGIIPQRSPLETAGEVLGETTPQTWVQRGRTWQARPEAFAGQKGIIEAVVDPLNLAAGLGEARPAMQAFKTASEELGGLARQGVGTVDRAIANPDVQAALRRAAPGGTIEDADRLLKQVAERHQSLTEQAAGLDQKIAELRDYASAINEPTGIERPPWATGWAESDVIEAAKRMGRNPFERAWYEDPDTAVLGDMRTALRGESKTSRLGEIKRQINILTDQREEALVQAQGLHDRFDELYNAALKRKPGMPEVSIEAPAAAAEAKPALPAEAPRPAPPAPPVTIADMGAHQQALQGEVTTLETRLKSGLDADGNALNKAARDETRANLRVAASRLDDVSARLDAMRKAETIASESATGPTPISSAPGVEFPAKTASNPASAFPSSSAAERILPRQAPSGERAIPPTRPPQPLPSIGENPESSLPTVRPTADILASAYNPDWMRRLADKLDNPVTRWVGQRLGMPTRDIAAQGTILRHSIISDWNSGITGTIAKLRQQGTSTKLFNVDKDGFASINGAKVAIGDLLENPGRYSGLTPEQRRYAETIHRLYDDQLAALRAEGIDVKTLPFAEGSHYVGRKVLGKLDEYGNVELAQVGGRSRIGSKAGFEKAREFATQDEAIRAGYRFLSPEEALQANLQAAGRRIADKRLADYVLSEMPYRTGAAPEELRLARDAAQEKLATLGKLQAVVNRAYRGERLPPGTIASISKHYPSQAKMLLNAGVTKAENPLERAMIQEVERQIPGLRNQAQTSYYKAKSALAEASEKASRARYGETSIASPAFAGKFFSVEDAAKLSRMLGLGPKSKLESFASAVSWANAFPRLLLTTFDVGAGLIQGQVALFSHPIVWAKAVGRSFQALTSEKGYQTFLATHANAIKEWSRYGATFTPSEFTSTALPTGLAGRTPVLRTAVKPFARSFEGLLNAMKVYGLEATGSLAKTPAEKAQMARFWNEMAGQVDTARMGIGSTQKELETAALFAPRYRRAIFALMSDISKGGLRGKLARDAVAKAIVAGMTGYLATWGIAHQIDPKGNPAPHLDPREGAKFLTINVAGQNIGMGGAFHSTGRTLLQMALQPDKAPELAARYVQSAMSPALSTINALRPHISETKKGEFRITGPEDYAGRWLDSPLKLTKEVVAGNLLPIWLQSALLDGQGGEGGAVQMAAEFFGGRAFPDSRPRPIKGSPIDRYFERTGGSASPVEKYLQSIGR